MERLKLNIARLKRNNVTLELDVDPDKAMEYKAGTISDVRDVLKVLDIFTDVQKGMSASENDLKKACDTSDMYEAIAFILKNGEVQLTDEYRKKKRAEKKAKIVERIRINAVDPKTHLPHPAQRIELAMDEAKIHIDENKSIDEQFDAILSKLKPIIPLRVEKKQLQITIPSQYAAKAYPVIKSFSSSAKEEWLNDGSLQVNMTIAAGLEPDVYEKINAVTHGNSQIEVTKIE